MAGRHAAKTSKKPLAIILVAAILVAAVVGGVLFFVFNGKEGNSDNDKATTGTTVAIGTSAEQAQTETASDTETQETAFSAVESTQSAEEEPQAETEADAIVVPTEADEAVSFFNATYIPNGEAVDAETGQSVSLREALGASYSEGVLTFNSDGTFSDSITANANFGSYVVQDNSIKATYADDRNMDITVTQWSDGAPSAFYVNYGGCIIYFG